MKTPEEIKKGLECCIKNSEDACYDCPYMIDCETFGSAGNHSRDALAFITQLEARVPKWISVKDRMPEPNTDVLLIAHGWKERSVYIGRLRTVEPTKSWLTGITSKGSDWTIWGFSYLVEPIVTHWMPLPEPQKEE